MSKRRLLAAAIALAALVVASALKISEKSLLYTIYGLAIYASLAEGGER